MVIEDLSSVNSSHQKWNPADPIERFFSFCLDFALLLPLITFVCSFHIREIDLDEAQGFQSYLWFSMLITGTFTSICLQAVFWYFFSSTPGQAMLNLRVQSLEGVRLEWGACFLRSVTFHLSLLLLFFPFLDVYTHRLGRCAHDRVSDSIVIQPYPRNWKRPSESQIWNLRLLTLVGVLASVLFVVMEFSAEIGTPSLAQGSRAREESKSLDDLVARALLLKDFDSETDKKLDELLWKTGEAKDRELVYFYRLKAADSDEEKEIYKVQICQTSKTELCQIIKDDVKSLVVENVRSRSALVAFMQDRAQRADYKTAFEVYDQLQLYPSLEVPLQVWDVALHLKIEEALKSKRAPASENLNRRLREFKAKRGLD